MSKVIIKDFQGGTRVWVDGNEIENVEKCTLDLEADRTPIATLKIEAIEYEIEKEVNDENIKVTRYKA